jgi:hypothetical protein
MKDLNSLINEIKNESNSNSNKCVDLESLISEVSGNGRHKKKDYEISDIQLSKHSLYNKNLSNNIEDKSDKESIISRKSDKESIISRKSDKDINLEKINTRKKYDEFIQPKSVNSSQVLPNHDEFIQPKRINYRQVLPNHDEDISTHSLGIPFHDIIDKEVLNEKLETESELSISASDSASNINLNNLVREDEVPSSINLSDPLDKIIYNIKKICKYKTRHLDNKIRNKERLKKQDIILTQIYLQTYNDTENHNIANMCKENIKSNTIKKNLPKFKDNPYINSDDEI